MLSGDNGILQKATDAKNQTGVGQEKEIVALAYNSALTKKMGNGDSTAVTSEDLNIELANQGATANGSNPIKVTFTASNRQYLVNENGEIKDLTTMLIKKITLSDTALSIQQGKSKLLTATIEPADAIENVKWISENENIAKVDENSGIVTVFSTATAGSTAVIKATNQDGSIVSSNSCIITVETALSEIEEGKNPTTYGREVNYDVDLGTDVNNNPLTWKVFYDDGTNVYLIASDCVKLENAKLTTVRNTSLFSQKGTYVVYDNSDMKTFKTQNATLPTKAVGSADTFSNTAPRGTKSLVDKGFLGFWKAKISTSTNKNAKWTAVLMDTKAWSPFVATFVSTATNYNADECYAIGGPTLSMWIESWNLKHGLYSSDSNKVQLYYNNIGGNGKGYYVGNNSIPSAGAGNLSSSTGYIEITNSGSTYTGDLYFPHKTKYNNCEGYWLISPSYSSNLASWACSFSGVLNSWDYYNGSFGVRPVVCLPSGVKISDIPNEYGKYDIVNKTLH